MKRLYLDPLFPTGLALRALLLVLVVPVAATDWYVPFLQSSIDQPAIDPWETWLAGGQDPLAFPYGYVMWLVFLPLALLAKLTGLPLFYGYSLTLLAADVGLLFVLNRLLVNRERLLLAVYWLSPIVLLSTYVLGLNDLIPVLLLTLSLYCTRTLRLTAGGVLCIAAISAKLSMVLALPFFLIYFIRNPALRQLWPQFLKGSAVAALTFGLPFVLSGPALHMLFSNPEITKVYQFELGIGKNIAIYVVPLTYSVMLYAAWRVRRLNFDLWQFFLGMAFLLVVLLTPASPGWFVWALPLLVVYQAMSGRIAIALCGAFSALYVLSTLLVTPAIPINASLIDRSTISFPLQLGPHALSLMHTAMTAIGIILALRIWRESLSRNDFFRLSRKPFVIGIAGDSGAGKDTVAGALEGLFGGHSVVNLSGDDYHLWDRHKPMWQVMTHLNPTANDLEGFTNDLVSLADGRPILSRHYDHQTGKMSRPLHIKSNDFIIASGLHALYLPILRSCYDLSIYLDIDERLRRHFKLERDINQRGHSIERVLAALERREPDSARFVRPQAAHADLVLSLQPIHPRLLEHPTREQALRFKLVVRTRHGMNQLSLTRVLVGVCGLHVDAVASTETTLAVMTIEGDTSAEDIALAARILCPRILDFLDIRPKWQDGAVGLMQLIALSHINQALTKRFI